MLAIQVRLLAGHYVATQFDDRQSAEWPPHPARLFAAAVAAWAEADEPDPGEQSALQWWESLGAPTIVCSDPDETATRSVVTRYVPVNDVSVLSRDASAVYRELAEAIRLEGEAKEPGAERVRRRARTAAAKAQAKAAGYARSGTAPEGALSLLPQSRMRQPRTFPSATPPDEVVVFAWPDAEDNPSSLAALDQVLSRIGRLGHTSSPVDVAVVPAMPREPDLEPGGPAELTLRTAAPGQLAALVAAHDDHQGVEPRILPTARTAYRRRQRRPQVRGSIFDTRRWLVFDLQPRRSLTRTLALTRALRDALMAHGAQPPPSVISGHGESGPLAAAHAAFLALPYVGSQYADGSIHALAVVLPESASEDDRSAVVDAAARWQASVARLFFGREGEYKAQILNPEDASITARASNWTRPSEQWSSVTPIALDRHPGSLGSRDPDTAERAYLEAVQSVLRACTNIGLPEPAAVTIRFDAPVRATRSVSAFPPYRVGHQRLKRQLVHVDLTFAEEVQGPVILGAGRYFGYGLCVPDRQARTR